MSALSPSIGKASFPAALKRTYSKLERISVDYAVMEKADNIVVATCAFGWDDVGTWVAAAAHLGKDSAGNAVAGCTEIVGGAGNIAISDASHLVALYGVSDLVVIHTRNATLVCPKGKAQDLKELVKTIAKRNDGARFL